MKATGALMAGVGAVVVAAGIALLAVFGFDGTLSTDRHMVASSTPVLVSSQSEIHGLTGFADAFGDPTVRIDLSDDRFVGVGRAKDVERWLAGTTYEEVSDIETSP